MKSTSVLHVPYKQLPPEAAEIFFIFTLSASARYQPLLIRDSSRVWRELTDLALDPAQHFEGFRLSLLPSLLVSLAMLVRAMNCYAAAQIPSWAQAPAI